MVDFYLPLKILKERLSPAKELNLTNPDSSTNASKRLRSEDDPFNDTKKLRYDERTPERASNSGVNKSPFIKKKNLNKIRERVMPSEERVVTTAMTADEGGDATGDVTVDAVADVTVEDTDSVADDTKAVAAVAAAAGDETTDTVADVEVVEDEVPLEVLEEMHKLEICFPTLSSNYRLIDKIGEGTFSTVYKAEAINDSVKLGSEIWKSPPLRKKSEDSSSITGNTNSKKKKPIVALKQIYVTSSPNRIHNELQLLFLLSGNSHVAPLLDILRYQDQVLAIMPYYQHADYRDFYRDLPIQGVKKYMWELFHALSFIHDKNVIHRDLKPTNFLYDPFKGKGVLVDFGLAERVEPLSIHGGSSSSSSTSKSITCPCLSKDTQPLRSKRHNVRAAYPKQDQRPPRRANRAGTRGFRAPEVLFKCTNQLTKLDIWSAGIIGLSFISRKFPLFNSPDDIDALLEIVLIFGLEKLQQCAELHGCGLEINLPHINSHNQNGNLIRIIADFLRFEWNNCTFPPDTVALDTLNILSESGDQFVKPSSGNATELQNFKDHVNFIQMLNGCFKMDPTKRLSAKEILKLPLFEDLAGKEEDEVIF